VSHQPVLLDAALESLAIKPAGVYIDATFGRGGHSAAILRQLDATGRLIAIDRDAEAVAYARQQFADDSRFSIIHSAFSHLYDIAARENLVGKVDGILLDLGVSSPQLDKAERGFSFLQDGPLDMRMDSTQGKTVADWLATAKEAEIADVLWTYGEERHSRRMARAIVAARAEQAITTTGQLAEIVKAANPRWEKTKHPATRAFQALRVFINQELAELEKCLAQTLEVLAVGGRLVVMSFHSLEDRIVKQFIRRHSRGEELPAYIPVVFSASKPKLKSFGRPRKATESEIAANPRSRSALLRIAEKLL
jgi:16S rRNA (cytosine1402-N4)-methyltransferase